MLLRRTSLGQNAESSRSFLVAGPGDFFLRWSTRADPLPVAAGYTTVVALTAWALNVGSTLVAPLLLLLPPLLFFPAVASRMYWGVCVVAFVGACLFLVTAKIEGPTQAVAACGVLAIALWAHCEVLMAVSAAARISRSHLLDQATRDGLTGVLNRAAFETLVEHEIKRSQRYGDDLTLLLADVDGLKSINDKGGHPAGDAAIRALAGALRDSVRDADVVGRIGGDEFGVMLTGSTGEAGALVARRLEAVADQIAVTASVGWATRGDYSRYEDLYAAADRALYSQKSSRSRMTS